MKSLAYAARLVFLQIFNCGNDQENPCSKEGDSAERRDGAEDTDLCQRQNVQASGEEDDSNQHQPAGP